MPQLSSSLLFPDFATASAAALALLQERLGLGIWIIARTVGDDWIVLGSSNQEPRYRDIHVGDVFPWSESFCVRMVNGDGPRIAPVVADVPAYRDAPSAKRVPIGSYVGVPIVNGDGSLFGTLCAFDPAPQDAARLQAQEPVLELVARLLATLLDRELRLDESTKKLERAEHDAAVDALTGLWNRRAWDDAVAAEEARCRRYGHGAGVVSLDLDGLKVTNDTHGHAAGDELIRRCARALKGAVRDHDGVARVGGDEFNVLLVHADEATAQRVVARIRASLAAEGVEASLGWAKRDPKRGLVDATARADALMYEEKRRRKGAAA